MCYMKGAVRQRAAPFMSPINPAGTLELMRSLPDSQQIVLDPASGAF
jgi:hypothetical protein